MSSNEYRLNEARIERNTPRVHANPEFAPEGCDHCYHAVEPCPEHDPEGFATLMGCFDAQIIRDRTLRGVRLAWELASGNRGFNYGLSAVVPQADDVPF